MTTYRKPRVDLEPGQVRFKSWRYVIPPDTPEQAEIWGERAAAYWQRQAELYGFKAEFGDIKVYPDYEVVESWVRVTEVLPGTRVQHHSLKVNDAQPAA